MPPEEPAIGLGIPGLARRAEDAQRAELVGVHVLGTVRHERAHRRRREPHDRDLVALDQLPETIGSGIVRDALEEDGGPAVEEPRGDQHRPHQPAQVGQPEQAVARSHVHQVAEVVGALQEKPALREHRALRPARRPRRVDDEARTIELDRQRGALGRLLADQLVPPVIAPGIPRDLPAEPLVDDHVLDRGRRGRRLVGGLLHLHDLPAPIEAVGRHQHPGFTILEPRGDGVGAVAREARGVDGSDSHDRKRGDGRLGRHREEHPHAVALSHAETLERVGELVHLTRQLAVRQAPATAVVALPDDRRLLSPPGVEVAVDTVVGEAHQTALEPARPLEATGDVAHARVRTRESKAEIAHDRVPVPIGVRDAPALQLGQRADTEGSHEARDTGALGVFARGPPDDLARGGLGHEQPPATAVYSVGGYRANGGIDGRTGRAGFQGCGSLTGRGMTQARYAMTPRKATFMMPKLIATTL